MKALLFALLLAVAPRCFAQPIIVAFANNYSYIAPGLPNYGIAQGSIFDIFGTNLAAGPTPLTNPPLPTELATVSGVAVVNGVTTKLILYYVSPSQIVAILPSSTPVGTGILAVTVNGKTSAQYPITVVPSAFGILTMNNAGNGPASAFDARSNTLSYTNAANPGETITLWGTGAGPATGDETMQQVPQNLSSVPIEVDIGGIVANVQYHGRSIYSGLDQINVVVPNNVTAGCFVSVVVKSGAFASNYATIPVAVSGRICSDQTTGLTSSVIQSLSTKLIDYTGTITFGKTIATSATGAVTTTDNATASFLKYTPADLSKFAPGQVASLGSCSVYTFVGNSPIPAGLPQGGILDAGPSISISGGTSSPTITNQNGVYQSAGGNPPIFVPASGGTFDITNSAAGIDIGTFDVKVTLPSPITWTNQSGARTVNRSLGFTAQWTGGDPNSFVQISGGSTTISINQPVGVFFNCTAPVSAGQFTIPSSVWQSIPAGSSGATLTVANYTYPKPFTAAGLDSGLATGYIAYTSAVTYQ